MFSELDSLLWIPCPHNHRSRSGTPSRDVPSGRSQNGVWLFRFVVCNTQCTKVSRHCRSIWSALRWYKRVFAYYGIRLSYYIRIFSNFITTKKFMCLFNCSLMFSRYLDTVCRWRHENCSIFSSGGAECDGCASLKELLQTVRREQLTHKWNILF